MRAAIIIRLKIAGAARIAEKAAAPLRASASGTARIASFASITSDEEWIDRITSASCERAVEASPREKSSSSLLFCLSLSSSRGRNPPRNSIRALPPDRAALAASDFDGI